ncbi:cyclase family protein [Desulfosporosinus sp. PR]|uniref:cyclase family protein n=1 Tax=Candidatus Desulfosporosinus nitrosoreducens TaxID=3401928 RepID=UPI0027F810F9|nr:cyclase family protein [Desulfosporosinus sp. PR]MDQ7097073.1 cyclase family protein [Desulfosporosinus sp. PR]
MRYDLSFKVDKKVLEALGIFAQSVGQSTEKAGHVGTHFDVMDKEFPLEKMITKGRVFDVSNLKSGEVNLKDIDLSLIQPNDFVMFYSGILKKYGYGTKEYFSTYLELADELIDALIAQKVSFIGVDMGGAKQPKDHPRIDQYCADRGIFIIENLNNLDLLSEETKGKPFTVYTFPVNMSGFSGLPCRVVAET